MDPRDIPGILTIDDTSYETGLPARFLAARRPPALAREIRAFIPGIIRRIYVAPGQRLERGDPILVFEAMKMENDLVAPRRGVVRAVHTQIGAMVAKGQLLIELDDPPRA